MERTRTLPEKPSMTDGTVGSRRIGQIPGKPDVQILARNHESEMSMSNIRYQATIDPARIRQLWSGAALRVFRKRSPWTQDALARRLGVSDSTWSRLEQGTLALEPVHLAQAERFLGLESGASEQWGVWLAQLHGSQIGTTTWRYRRAQELIPPTAVDPGK